MDRTALDWTFSTTPQAIAALVGLIFAGVSFIIATINKEIEADSTREDICIEMKKDIHSNLKVLFILAGISIIADLIILLLDPLEEGKIFSFYGNFDLYILISAIFLTINIGTIIYSLFFILKVANPNFFNKMVEKLSSEQLEGDVDKMEFIREYIEFEKELKKLDIPIDTRNNFPTTLELIKALSYNELINRDEYAQLREINSVRNLILHGGNIQRVPHRLLERLVGYKEKIKNLDVLRKS